MGFKCFERKIWREYPKFYYQMRTGSDDDDGGSDDADDDAEAKVHTASSGATLLGFWLTRKHK